MTQIKADWLSAAPTQRIFTLLTEAGFQAYVVGGCVRNTLMGQSAKDIDFTTDAHPEIVTELAEEAGIKVIPTGIEHGTVTLISDGMPFEVTTFRRDVATDGRRATVAFSDNVTDDARRRDFTINALYADAGGNVVDPLNGLPDLHVRRLRFVEEADQRIKEDYLRSLRFFRFHAWYGDPDEGLDPEALNAIARNLDGLETLSRERIGSEILRLLEAPDPAPAVASMRQTGVLRTILPGADDGALAALVYLEEIHGLEPDPIRRLAVLGGEEVSKRLRLSRKQAETLNILRNADPMASPGVAGYRLGQETAASAALISAASLSQNLPPNALTEIQHGASQTFTLKAADLMPDLSGPALGDALKALETQWIESGFELSRDDLLKRHRNQG